MGWQLPFTSPCIEFASKRKAINNVKLGFESPFWARWDRLVYFVGMVSLAGQECEFVRCSKYFKLASGCSRPFGTQLCCSHFWSHPKPAKFMRDLSHVSTSIDSRCWSSIKLLGALQCWCIMIYSGDSICGHKKQRSKWWDERNEAKVTTPIMFNHLTGPIWRRNNHNFSSAIAAFYPSWFTCIYSGAGGSHSTLFV